MIKKTADSDFEIIQESPVEIQEYYEPPAESTYTDNSGDNYEFSENRMSADEIPSIGGKEESPPTEEIPATAPLKQSAESDKKQGGKSLQKTVLSKAPRKEIIAVSETGGLNFAVSENSAVLPEKNLQSQNGDFILKKVKTLYILDNYDQGLKLLTDNWEKFSYSKNKNNSELSAAAILLKGKLFFKKAENINSPSKAKEFYQKAIKSFYEVLSRFNARECPSAPEAIKLFRKTKKQYEKLYKTKVGFPPEF
jgi:hypothetical protein